MGIVQNVISTILTQLLIYTAQWEKKILSSAPWWQGENWKWRLLHNLISNFSPVIPGCFSNLTSFIEPTCAYCVVGSYASLSVRLSVCLSVCLLHLIKIHSSESITLWEKFMWANGHGIIALTGRAHCQRQVAFFYWPFACKHYTDTTSHLHSPVRKKTLTWGHISRLTACLSWAGPEGNLKCYVCEHLTFGSLFVSLGLAQARKISRLAVCLYHLGWPGPGA